MATRSGVKPETLKESSEHIYRDVTKVYGFWFLGIVIGAIGLKPTSINAAGLVLAIERPDIIQGLVYWIALFYASRTFMNGGRTNPYARRAGLRYAIWSSLPKGTRSLRHKTKAELMSIKSHAKKVVAAISVLPMFFAAVPVLLIVIFNPLKLAKTLGAIVGIT